MKIEISQKKKKILDIFIGKLHCLEPTLLGDSILSVWVGHFTNLYGVENFQQCQIILIYGHANQLFLMDVQLTLPPCMEKTSFMSICRKFQLFFGTYKSLPDFPLNWLFHLPIFPYAIELNKIFNTWIKMYEAILYFLVQIRN